MNRHLNIFNFFNSSNLDYLEDNLSRAFALCLKYDSVFLDKVLKSVLPERKYSELFNTDYPDYKIEIDLQNRASELEGFSDIIAVACSGKEILDFDSVAPRETGSPETDVSIVINDTCILFEFKRTSEDCAAQLKCQAEKVKRNCPEGSMIEYRDLSWGKIVRILLNVSSLQKQIHTENPFTIDFIKFLENFPHWFPARLLKNIPFPKTENDPNRYYLESRLKQIKNQLYGEERAKEYVGGRYSRYVISAENFGWINEIQVEPEQKDGNNFLVVKMFPGDTKQQGKVFFQKNPGGIDWQADIAGCRMTAEPYIRFAHFNSSIFWLRPTLEESRKTHNLEFFNKYAGRHWKRDWQEIESVFERYFTDWKSRCEWTNEIENSNRSYFDLALGTLLTVYLPYEECQRLDDSETETKLASRIRKIINAIQQTIDGKFI